MLSDLIEDLPSGPAIVLGEFVIFLLAMGWGRFRDRHLHGRQMTAVGTGLVLIVYAGVFLLIACQAYTAGKGTERSAAVQQTQIESGDWSFFVSSLQKKSFDDINQRIDSDAEFTELLTRRIKALPISEKEKQSILNAIDTMDWSGVSAKTIDDLSRDTKIK
jgi:hypothetical protein